MSDMEIYPLGDCAVVIQFSKMIEPSVQSFIQKAQNAIECHPFSGFLECTPAYTTLTVFYDPVAISYAEVIQKLRHTIARVSESEVTQSRIVSIPVCYGGVYGPDLSFVAQYHGLTESEVIKLHTSPEYQVFMIGFAPGFPYLGGLSKRLVTPRKTTPRSQIQAGSVGIAGEQTGIYSVSTPGGWQIIGRTPIQLFHVENHPPSLLQAGDKVRFIPITEREYKRLEMVGIR
ncbi:5-oxoprolinase subunit PxpB [Sulfoacidibacillus thermotolerans]|uniref:Kinase inhibitor n=1 Tax=Sulfoacidibacillus thermotolerans TaxID=1765684 RepID=A0A2U3DAW2_SULT2|nr:5-oxoprolinase subunit PxpB [Sulfoacidibacillus thermotolerans]PWI58405.1 kinase inhibitor [Sulfoacidibacillus thermotolerans]